jgi:hypothetical protein
MSLTNTNGDAHCTGAAPRADPDVKLQVKHVAARLGLFASSARVRTGQNIRCRTNVAPCRRGEVDVPAHWIQREVHLLDSARRRNLLLYSCLLATTAVKSTDASPLSLPRASFGYLRSGDLLPDGNTIRKTWTRGLGRRQRLVLRIRF